MTDTSAGGLRAPANSRAVRLGSTIFTVALEMVARLALFGTVFALFMPSSGHGRTAAAVGLVASVAGFGRTFWRAELLHRAMADLWKRLLDASSRHGIAALRTEKDRGQASALVDATFELAATKAFAVPDLAGALASLAVVLLAVAIRLGPGWLAAGVGGALGGAVLLTPSRRRGRRARELAWEGHMRAARLFDTLLSGAFELRASGRDHALRTILSDVASGVARAERDGVRYGAALAALPLGLSAVLALAPSAWLASLVGARVGEAAVLATAGASFVLAALSAYEAVGRSRPLRRTFEEFEGRGAAAVAEAQASPDANPTPLDELTLEAITVRYPGADRPVVADLSARVRRGAGVALLGPNGVGKTTTLLVALGLLELDQGRVLLDGRAAEASRWAALRSRILVLPQRPHLVPEESIAWHLGLFGTAEPTPEKIERALERVGLLERLRARSHSSPGDIPMGALSAGEQRRVLLARAFVDECDLVVLDEPEAGLDDAGRADLKGLLGELARHRLVLAAVHDTTILPSELTRVHLGAHETDVVVDGRAGAPILS